MRCEARVRKLEQERIKREAAEAARALARIEKLSIEELECISRESADLFRRGVYSESEMAEFIKAAEFTNSREFDFWIETEEPLRESDAAWLVEIYAKLRAP